MKAEDRTIHKRLFLLLAGILAILIAAGGYLYYRHQENTIRKEKHSELKAIAELKINQLVQWRKERIADVRVITDAPFFARGVERWILKKTNVVLEEEIKERLATPQKEFGYGSIILASMEGGPLLSVGKTIHRFDPVTSEYIMKAVKNAHVTFTDFYYCTLENEIHYDIIAPLMNDKNLVFAVLIFRVNPHDYLYPLIQSWPTPSKTSENLIIRGEGDSILFLNELRFRTATALSFRIPLTQIEIPAVQSILGYEGIFEGKDYRGVEVLADIYRVPGTSWSMVSKVDRSEIFSDLYEQAIIISVFTGILMLLCGFGLVWIYHYRQRNIYKTLWQTQEEFRTTLYSIADAVITTDKKGRVQHLNIIAEQLTGWKEDGAKSKPLEEVFNIINEETRTGVKNPVQLVLKEGHVIGLANKALLISKDGREIPIADSGSPIRNEEGEIIGVVLVFRDQTEERTIQKALRDSETRYRRFFEAARDGILILDADTGIIIDVNPFLIEILGYTHDQFLGKKLWELGFLGDIVANEKKYLELRQKEYMRYDNLPMETAHKRKIEVEFVSNVYLVDHHEVIQCNIRDVTERKRAEEKILKLNRTYAVLSNINQLIVRERDKQKLFDGACKIAVEDGKFLMSWIGMLDEETGNVEPVASAGAADGYLEQLHITISDVPQGRGPTGTALREGRTIICDNIEHDERMIPWRERALALGYKSSAAFPLIVASKTIGALHFYSSEVHFFDEEEVYLLEELAADVSYALESLEGEEKRKRAEENLAKEQYLLDILMDNMPDHIYFKDTDSRFIRINKAHAKIFGLSDSVQATGKTDFDFFMEEHARQAFEDERKIVQTGQPMVDIEEKETWPDGQVSWVSTTKLPLRDKEGNIIGTFGISRDITGRKRTEEALRVSSERLHLALESANSGAWEWDLRTNENIWSDELWKLYGLEPHSCVPSYEAWRQTIHPDDRERTERKVQEAARKGSELNAEWRVVDRDGTIRWLMSRGRPWRDANGTTIRFIGIVSDMTERKQAEEALRESEENYRELINGMNETVWVIDFNGNLVDVNNAAVEVLGYSKEELLTIGLYGIDSSLKKEDIQALAKAMPSDKLQIFETSHTTKDGSTIPVEVYSSLVTYQGKKVILSIARNISERKRVEEQLRQMQKLEGLGTLAGGISHDFNNILGIIMAYTTSIQRCKDDINKIEHAADTIMKAVERGKTLVQQVLTFARKTETEFGSVNVNDVVMEIMSMILETFPKVLTYSQNFDKGIPYIFADRSQLHQALLNLCVNARDAMPSGGVLTINTSMVSGLSLRPQHRDAAESSYICIEVSDTGEGMTPETQSRVFEPFFTTKEQGKGTGLGLAVVFGVVQTHKGFINVESELGKGTTFRLYLPALSAEAPVETKIDETVEAIPGGTETLLLVEDEEALIMPLQTVLVEKGYNVLSADDGMKALKIYKERKNDIALVLTDLGLPTMTGMEECQKIKKINPDARIIVATGFLDPEMKLEFLKAGIQYFLYKPYDLREVLKMVRAVLDEK